MHQNLGVLSPTRQGS